MTAQRVLRNDALWEGEMLSVHIDERPILLTRFDGQVVAYVDRCPHFGARLSTGHLDGAHLTCPAHGWRFDLRTGRGLNPCGVVLQRTRVRVADDAIWIDPHEVLDGK